MAIHLRRDLEAGGRAAAEEVIDLRRAITEAVGALQPAADAKAVRIETRTLTKPASVRAEPEAIREAVGNLLDNAIKYAPEASIIDLHLDVDGGHATISVTDRGVGIAASEQVGSSSASTGSTRLVRDHWAAPAWVSRSSSTSRSTLVAVWTSKARRAPAARSG